MFLKAGVFYLTILQYFLYYNKRLILYLIQYAVG